MGDSFFECPWVWLFSACVAGLVLLARCDMYDDGYDPYAGCPSSPDTRTASGYAVARHSEAPWLGAGADDADGYAMEVYEEEMVPGFVGTESRSVYAEATPLRNSGESEMLANSLPPCVEGNSKAD